MAKLRNADVLPGTLLLFIKNVPDMTSKLRKVAMFLILGSVYNKCAGYDVKVAHSRHVSNF
jgi:hypothetical protein